MSNTLSTSAKQLLQNGRNLSGAAKFLADGNSTFGEWCVPGLLPKQGTAVIYGPTGAGKTFLTLRLALSIAGEANCSVKSWAGVQWFTLRQKIDSVSKHAQ
jgi:KaiC/GvpD/RAD55 family RecA-like ATPase